MQQNVTAGGAYSAPLDSIAGFKGPLHGGKGEREGEKVKEGRGREREKRGREGGEWEGRLTLMRSWKRAANWLRPALAWSMMFSDVFRMLIRRNITAATTTTTTQIILFSKA